MKVIRTNDRGIPVEVEMDDAEQTLSVLYELALDDGHGCDTALRVALDVAEQDPSTVSTDLANWLTGRTGASPCDHCHAQLSDWSYEYAGMVTHEAECPSVRRRASSATPFSPLPEKRWHVRPIGKTRGGTRHDTLAAAIAACDWSTQRIWDKASYVTLVEHEARFVLDRNPAI